MYSNDRVIHCMYNIVSASDIPPMQLASEAGAAAESEKKRLEQLLCDSAELKVNIALLAFVCCELTGFTHRIHTVDRRWWVL